MRQWVVKVGIKGGGTAGGERGLSRRIGCALGESRCLFDPLGSGGGNF